MYVQILINVYDSLLVYETMSVILLKNNEKFVFTSKSMTAVVSSRSENNFYLIKIHSQLEYTAIEKDCQLEKLKKVCFYCAFFFF